MPEEAFANSDGDANTNDKRDPVLERDSDDDGYGYTHANLNGDTHGD